MKKALLLILGIVLVCFFLVNASYLASVVSALQGGAPVPLLLALVLMIARHVVQAVSYDAAFEAVSFKTGLRHNIVLIFSLVFINTFCPFSGATGVAFIIDDAHRKGADMGTATSGAILTQIGYFAALLVVSIIGFVAMLLSGSMNVLFVVGGIALAGVLLALSSLFVVALLKPAALRAFFGILEKALNRIASLAKKGLRDEWGRHTAESFISSAQLLVGNPKGTLACLAYAALSALLNMACLVAIGSAFGFTHVLALVAAFAVASVSVVLSPTPQGVGVVEAAITAILTAYGCPLGTATAIALVYRGIMFWVPFCVGALMLSRTDFFAGKKDAAPTEKAKDVAWLAGVMVLVVGLVNMGFVLVPQQLTPFLAIASWVDMRSILIGPMLFGSSLLLVLLGVGLILRLREAWALSVATFVFIAGIGFLFESTVIVAFVALGLVVWLLIRAPVFNRGILSEEILSHAATDLREALLRARKKLSARFAGK